MGRIARIVESSRQVAAIGKGAEPPAAEAPTEPPPSPQDERLSAAVTAARALAERAARRRDGHAA